ncbi:glycosyl hydrolase family 28-related protein [Algirhabdus cladophorae]|uniref:glycosyl hydrolase family 28-related protein n=1 Tax=Algirhabdus cladophorae TaxID=3377108 RepID=UPI003B847DF4
MNKVITEGWVLTPPAFSQGLDVWSSQDGTPGSATYDGSANGIYVPADQDFGGCLELIKTSSTQNLRYMGQTPLVPGCYLRIKARVKALSGPLPTVRIAAWAGDGNNNEVSNIDTTGPDTTLTTYGEVVEINAIIGSGNRSGVDMAWGTTPTYAHIGLDLTGATGGAIRVDDIEIEDITGAFLRDMIDLVDVKDFGAIGDGITDDSAAFNAADAASDGRRVFVPAGVYFLGNNVTMDSSVTFEGTVQMPVDKRLALRKNFDLPSYIEAFGDEVEAFKKAFQALLNSVDHTSLDMGGRRVQLDGPIDVQAAVDNKDVFASRRVLRNGEFDAQGDVNWETAEVTSSASYTPANPRILSNVANIANIEKGSLVEGDGVGREIYVNDVNVSAQTITLSQPFYGAASNQTYTFKRFRYILDFSGFASLSKFKLDGVDFLCNNRASGVMLPPDGLTFRFNDCAIAKPVARCITSIGTGCQGLMVDNCRISSGESAISVQNRTTLALNCNGNDVKLRNNRISQFQRFAVLGGSGNLIVGNHWFMGDDEVDGLRVGGLVFTDSNSKSVITGNYIDNNFIELTNEYEPTPEYTSSFSFGGLSITGNIFTVNDVNDEFSFIVVKPFGSGHYLQGLSVTGNVFRSLNGSITRVDKLDDSFASLNYSRTVNVVFDNNTFNAVENETQTPASLRFEQNTDASTWVISGAPYMPFGGRLRVMEAFVQRSEILSGSTRVSSVPWAETQRGTNKDEVHLHWDQPCRGEVQVRVRCDNPL